MLTRRIDRLFQLLRYHHPSQLVWRGQSVLRQRWQRRFPSVYRPRTDPVQLRSGSSELLGKLRRRRHGLWPRRQSPHSLSAMAEGEFRFLNQTRSLVMPSAPSLSTDNDDIVIKHLNWQPDAPRLWRFHLQYHESLLEFADAVGGQAAWQMIESWLTFPSNQTPYLDADAWHPFCLSIRLPNWLMLAESEAIPPRMSVRFWQSVSEQVDWLWQHPEWDLGGNHLLENLRTLAIADASLSGDTRIDRSKLYRWIDHEIKVQLLPSGEHFERTPTYHALMLLAMIEIADSAEAVGVDCKASEASKTMAGFLETILHPDDQIPLFGDSVFAETPSPRILINDALANDQSVYEANRHEYERYSDYWVQRSKVGQDQIIFDIGDVACDHLPAHAHADLLTIEASAFGHRFLVDTGTFDYEETLERSHCRSTRSHNTSRIDDQSQCDIWSRFRMGRRGHVLGHRDGASNTHAWCLAAHNAYQQFGISKSYRLIVADRRLDNGLGWLVADWFEGSQEHRLSSPLHIGPDFKYEQVNDEIAIFGLTMSESSSVFVKSSTQISLTEVEYHPDFGARIPINRIEQTTLTREQIPLIWYLSTAPDLPLPSIEVTAERCVVHWHDDFNESLIIPTNLNA